MYGGSAMDRRQRKTRGAIFQAFSQLLSQKDFSQITVGEIIDNADISRATFYAHFETKDFLLKELCEELFCHIFDAENGVGQDHWHIFECNDGDSAFLHLCRHLQKNDNNILALLSSQNNELFLGYFRTGLDKFLESHLDQFEAKRSPDIPLAFWKSHITTTFVGTLKWWIDNGMRETPEEIVAYFFAVV